MKIFKIAALLVMTLAIQFAFAQTPGVPFLQFKKLKDLPSFQQWPAAATDGKYLYSINGYSPLDEITPYIFRYDPENNQWGILSKKAGNKVQASAAFVPAQKKIYIFGGLIWGRNIYRQVQSIDVNTGSISELKVHNPIAGSLIGTAVWDNQVYLFGGTQKAQSTSKNLYRFDPASTTFTKLADMPEGVETSGAIVNGTLYTFGGYDQYLDRTSTNINAYDIKTNTWKTVVHLPFRLSATNVVAYHDLIFAIGNYHNDSFIACYDTRTNKFTQLESNMEPRRSSGVAIINSTLYIFGGKTNQKQFDGGVASVEAADLSQFLSYTSK